MAIVRLLWRAVRRRGVALRRWWAPRGAHAWATLHGWWAPRGERLRATARRWWELLRRGARASLRDGWASRLGGAWQRVRPLVQPLPRRVARWFAPTDERSPWRLVATATAVGLALATVAVALAGPWDAGRRRAERDRAAAWGEAPEDGPDRERPGTVPQAGPVLAALEGGGRRTAPPSAKALARLLGPLLKDDALGEVRTAAVVDVASGRQVFAVDAAKAVTPASTIKLATTAAALSALGPDHRIETRVLWDGDRDHPTVVLVGGGDPTLSKDRLRDLARQTARALRRHLAEAGADDKPAKVAVRYDARLYSGPRRHPLGENPNIAPVTALMLNEGRLDDSRTGPAPRSDEPARDAAEAFASLLRKEGLRTTGDPTAVTRRATGQELADTFSAPLSSLVERTLTHSDNDLAEALARQVAVARGEPASFAGAGRAVRAELARLKLPLDGARFADGSGLNRADRVSAALLTALLTRAADPGRPELRPVLTGLPVAHFSGTLRGRFDEEGGADGAATASAAGLVRAKTGTLTGVTSLAGTVVDADGRLLAFAFLSADGSDRVAGHAALDRLAAAVAGCGCR